MPLDARRLTSRCSPAHSPVSLLATSHPATTCSPIVLLACYSFVNCACMRGIGPECSQSSCTVGIVHVHASARPPMCVAVRELARTHSHSPTCRRPVRALLAHPLTGLDHPYSRTPFRLLARLPFVALACFMTPGCCPVCSFTRSPSRFPACLPVHQPTDCRSPPLTLSFACLSHAHTFACFPSHSSIWSFTRLLAAYCVTCRSR